MPPIAAQTADRIDYWIRRRVIQPCDTTRPSHAAQVGLSAIGRSLRDQYDALATPMPSHLVALVNQLEAQK
jgi:hypothetical protein